MKNHNNENNKQVVYGNGIKGAQTALNNIKLKDPGYNTQQLEALLATYQQMYDGLQQGRLDERDAHKLTLQYVADLIQEPFLLKRGQMLVGEFSEDEAAVKNALANSDAVIKEHEAKITEFLQTNPASNAIQNGLSYAKAKGNFVQTLIKQTEDAVKNARSIGHVYYLQQLHLCRAYLAGAVKVYPNENTLKENYNLAVAAIERIGTRESYMAQLKANYAHYIKNLRMRPAVAKDAAIEKLVKNEFERQFTSSKITVTKVNIVTHWDIEKNALDIPLHKELAVVVAIKKADGTCGLASAYVRQIYEGGGRYDAPYMNMPSAITTLPCENLK